MPTKNIHILKRTRNALWGVLALASAALVPAQAQVQRTFTNPSFETPVLPGNCYQIMPSDMVPGWETTNPSGGLQGGCGLPPSGTTSGSIELWSTPFNGVTARQGNNFAELNATTASRLYQKICLIQGETVGWRFSHRGRQSDTTRDVAEVKIGASTSVARVGTTNTGAFDTPLAYLGTVNAPPASVNSWRDYSGSFTYTNATGSTNFGFDAISSAGGSTSVGNFLDDVQLTLKPFVDFTKSSYSTLEGDNTNPVFGTDRPTIRVNGVVPVGGMTVTVKINSGTAVVGTDYFTNTTNGTSNSVTVFVDAGTYDGISAASQFALPIYIVGDLAVDAPSTKTIPLEIQTDPQAKYANSSNDVCGQAAAPSVYNIVDDDGPLTITKTVSSAPIPVAGSAVQFDIGYTVVVENSTPGNKNFTVTDTPAFDGDVTINSLQSLTCVRSSGNSVCNGTVPTGPINTTGPWVLNTSHSLNSGQSETYTMVVRFTINPGKAGPDQCDGAAGKGLYNSVTTNLSGSPVAAACQNTPTPVWVKLSKNVAGRAAPTDQFKVSISTGGISSGSAITSGAGTTASTSQIVPAGSTLQFFEALKPNGTGADQLPSKYTSNLTCTGSAVAPSGAGAGAAPQTQLTWPAFTPQAGDNLDCTITNTPITYQVTATAGPGGVVNNGALQCTGSPVLIGGSSSCSATPNPGYTFTSWTGACAGQPAICTLNNVTSDQSSAAVFSPLPGSLTVTKTVTGGPSPLPALVFEFTVSCTGGATPFSVSSVVSANNSVQVLGIPANSACIVTEGNKPLVNNYSWGPEQITNPTTPMAPGGTLAATIVNPLVANPGTLTVSKIVSGGPSPLPALSFSFTVSCTGGAAPASGFTATQMVSANSSTSVGNIPVGSSCTVSEGAKPAVTNYSWGTEQIANPTAPMAAGGALTATITNFLTRDEVNVTINKSIVGAPATGAPGAYGFSLVCDTGTYPGTVVVAANATSGSTSLLVPKGATCSALTETSKATPPTGYSWATETTTPPASPIALGAIGSIVNPLKTNAKITLQKTGPAVVLTGEQFNYSLTLTNTGELPTGPTLTVQDLLPEGMVFVSAPNGACTSATSGNQTLLTCTVPGPLTEASGATPSKSFDITVKAPLTAGPLTNYAAAHPSGSGTPPSPPGASCDSALSSCASWPTNVNTPAALVVTKSATATTPTGGLNQYMASYQLTVTNNGGSAGSYTLTDTPSFSGSATLTSLNAVVSSGNGALQGSFPISNPANGTSQQISTSGLAIAAGATHTYTVTVAYTMVGGSALACSGSAGNGAYNAASITGTTAASSNACLPLTGQATGSVTLKKAWSNGKAGDAVTLAISGSGVSGAVGGSSAVGGASTDASATAIVGSSVGIAEAWSAGNSANYDVVYSCDNGIGAATSFTMPNAAVTCTVTNTRKSAQLSLAKQWVNATSGDTVNITATYNGTTATVVSSATSTDKTDTGSSTATVYAGDVLTLPDEVFSTGDATKYSKTISCSAGSLSGKDLTVLASSAGLLCTYKNSGLPQVSATKAANPAVLIQGASGQSYLITVTVAGTPTTDVITIADVLPSGIKLSGAPTVAAGTGTSVPKLETCGAAGDTNLGASCTLSGTTGVGLNLGTYVITLPIDTSTSTLGATAGNNTAHLSGGGDPACIRAGNPPACNPSTGDVPVNTPAALVVTKSNNASQLTAGAPTTYTITITNNGGSPASALELQDVVGSGLTGVSSLIPALASPGSNLGTCAALVCSGITVAANGGTVSYTVTGTVGPAAPGALAVNTANLVGGGCMAGAGTSTPASCTATDSDPIVPVPPVVVDPPFITKLATLGSDGHVKWRIVLDNPNPAAMVVQMRDPMPAGMTFVSGSISCAANGASTVVAPPAGCYYDQANNRVVVDATLAPDNGTVAGANRVEVVFEAQFVGAPAAVTNTAEACWDTRNDTAGINACTTSRSAAATYTPGTTPQPPVAPAPVPALGQWALMLLSLFLAGWVALQLRRAPGSQR